MTSNPKIPAHLVAAMGGAASGKTPQQARPMAASHHRFGPPSPKPVPTRRLEPQPEQAPVPSPVDLEAKPASGAALEALHRAAQSKPTVVLDLTRSPGK